MTREEIIRLAFQSRLTEDLWLTDETDYPHLERFAELVAAEYKQDALRYRMLRSNERFSVDEKCGGDWEPVSHDQLDATLDEAIDRARGDSK